MSERPLDDPRHPPQPLPFLGSRVPRYLSARG